MRILKKGPEYKQIECPCCEALLEYTLAEVHLHGCSGTTYIVCPECHADIITNKKVDDENSGNEKELTIGNIVFPDDFDDSEGAVEVDDKQVNKYIRECLLALHNDKEDYGTFRYTTTGDTLVFACKYEDEYEVYVCKKNYKHISKFA